MNTISKNKIILAVTGASGSIYASEALKMLISSSKVEEVALIYSHNGQKVWAYEKQEDIFHEKIRAFSNDDLFAPPSSGSSLYNAMLVIPCSMGTLAKIAHGIADTLITRAADVMLKERRPLWLAVREAPYNLVHIKNMEAVTLAGGGIFPLTPFFYHHPKDIHELVQPLISRLLNLVGIIEPTVPWKE